MKAVENHIKVEKSFRYFTYGNIEKAKYLLFALHGYGQLGPFFIRKFQQLKEDYFIVCPEGMHRFYLEGTSGRVGASWMTKEDRLTDIEDNHQWLTNLFQTISKKNTFESFTILGFSQGGATAARWSEYLNMSLCLSNKLINEHSLILWASVFPPDLEINTLNSAKNQHYFVVGDEDEYFQDQNRDIALAFYESINYTVKKYQGTHQIDATTLQELLDYLHINNKI